MGVSDCFGYELSEGWVAATLGEVATVNPARPARGELADDALVTFVPMPAVDADSGSIVSPEQRPYGEVRKGYSAFRSGDVIFAKITPCMENGKAALAEALSNGIGFGSTEFHVLRATDAVLPEFIYHFVRQESFRKHAEASMTGSVGQWRVPALFMEQSAIPLPPLLEQKRIVAKIEELIPKVNAVKTRLGRASQIMKRFRQAVLRAACSGRLTEGWRGDHELESKSPLMDHVRGRKKAEFEEAKKAASKMGQRPPQQPLNLDRGLVQDLMTFELPEIPDSWQWVALRDVTVYAQYGTSVKAGMQQRGTVPILRMGNIQDGKLDLADLKYVRLDDELKPFVLDVGDLLFNRTNSPELVGKSAVFDSRDPFLFASYLIRIKLDRDLVNPTYLCHWMNSASGRAWATEVRTDGVSQSNINATKLSMAPLPLPSLPEQDEIVRRIDELFQMADGIEARIRTAAAHSERLGQSLLVMAFRGELVPTEAELARQGGRSYEPASALLERVVNESGILRKIAPTERSRG